LIISGLRLDGKAFVSSECSIDITGILIKNLLFPRLDPKCLWITLKLGHPVQGSVVVGAVKTSASEFAHSTCFNSQHVSKCEVISVAQFLAPESE
jgi:hypothetical protein